MESADSPVCGFWANDGMKRMKRCMMLALAIVTLAETARAHLGDTSDRIEDMYGTIVQRRLRDDGTVNVVYTKGQYLYLVTFANNRSISESYSHAKGTDLSQKEITRFLKANHAGTWVPTNSGMERRFKTSDGTAEATYGIVNGRPALTVRDLRP